MDVGDVVRPWGAQRVVVTVTVAAASANAWRGGNHWCKVLCLCFVLLVFHLAKHVGFAGRVEESVADIEVHVVEVITSG